MILLAAKSDAGHRQVWCERCTGPSRAVRTGIGDDGWDCRKCQARTSKGVTLRDNAANGITVLEVHYASDPAKDPDTPDGRAWLKEAMKAYAGKPADWQSEMELNHDTTGGPRIYPEFDLRYHYNPGLGPEPGAPLIVSFDWGAVHPAGIVAQWNARGQFCILLEVLGDNTFIEPFTRNFNRLFKTWFFDFLGVPEAEPTPALIRHLQEEGHVIAYGDWFGGNIRNSSGFSNVELVEQFGWRVRGQYAMPSKKIERVRSLMQVRDDGTPRLLLRGLAFDIINGAMPEPMLDSNLKVGFLGGYQYRTDARGERVETKTGPSPDKGIYSHLQDAVQEAVYNTFKLETDGVEYLGHPDRDNPSFFSVNARRETQEATSASDWWAEEMVI